MHRDPTRRWTLGTLVAEAAMSRSAFAARFSELVGESAMHYVTRWRMHAALTWLKGEGLTVAEAAERLGYQSEAAFSRAFKRFMGTSPGSAARSHAGAWPPDTPSEWRRVASHRFVAAVIVSS